MTSAEVPQVGINHPKAVAARFQPGQSGNPGGVSKATGLSGSTMRARLREKLEADEARLQRILEARIALAEDSEEPAIQLKAIDDLIEQIDGKLEKTQRNVGEPTVVVINGPKPVEPPPDSP